jgi:DNA-binding beta-propeller fold protein YncE
MDESSLTALFERATAARPPTPQLVPGSLQLGKKLRLRRRIHAAVATALVVGLIGALGPAAFGALSHQAPATRRHTALPETLYSASSYGELVPIRVSSGAVGTTIQTAGMSGSFGTPLAVAPDHVIYAATSEGVIPIYTATHTVGRPIRVTSHDYIQGAIVVTPDGKTAYVMEVGVGVVPVNLASRHRGKVIRVAATQLVMTTDGGTLYVLGNSHDVVPIRTATNTALPPIPVGTSRDNWSDIVVSPAGATAYVLSGSPARNGGQLTPISTATNTAQRPITVPGVVLGLAISPDGQTAYVTAHMHRGYVLLPIDLATRTVLTPVRLPARFWEFGGVVFTPDGRMAYVAMSAPGTQRGTAIIPIMTASNTAQTPIRVGLSTPTAIAVSPDGSTVYVSGKLRLGWYKYAVFPIRVGAHAAARPISVPKVPMALVFAP